MPSFIVRALACLALALLPCAANGKTLTLRDRIQHVVIIMQENRSFDTYFGTYPGADGLPAGACLPDPLNGGCDAPFHDTQDVNYGASHTNPAAVLDLDGGTMDGFVHQAVLDCQSKPGYNPACAGGQPFDVMGYHTAAEIPNYWAYAQHFTLQDHLFEPALSWSLPQHLYMISGWSAKCASGDPLSCQSDIGTDMMGQTPPLFSWTDMTYLLHNAGLSWGYYAASGTPADCMDGAAVCQPTATGTTGTVSLWNPLPYFETVQQNGQVGSVQPMTNFIGQARAGTLPTVSWVVPSQQNSEHPPSRISAGQAYVTTLINNVMAGPDWGSTAIILAWDDWGGFYDHETPPTVDGQGYGFRVPSLIISPWVRAGLIDHQVCSFDHYNKLIEDLFLGSQRLDPATDGRPDSRPTVREALGSCDLRQDFNPNQTPLPPLALPPYPNGTPTPTASPTAIAHP